MAIASDLQFGSRRGSSLKANQVELQGVPSSGIASFKVETAHVAASKKGPESRKK